MVRRKWNEETAKVAVEELGYKFISYDYRKIKNRWRHFVTIECKNGHVDEYYLENVLSGKSKCIECKGKKKTNLKDIKEKLGKKNLKLKRIISEGKLSYHTEVEIECEQGHTYQTTVAVINMGCGCPECYGNKKTDFEDAKKYVESQGDELIDMYFEDGRCMVVIKCSQGHTYTTPYTTKYKQGRRCGYCNMSSGEQIVYNTLLKYNIKCEYQYTYDDCKIRNCLPFDFYLPDYNILIEFDGEQHYRPVNWGSIGWDKALDNFILLKVRDTIKTIYAKSNNIKLIRISYLEIKNIENILIKELHIRRKGNKKIKSNINKYK